jgi:hypothetical protein
MMAGSTMRISINVEGDGQCEGRIEVGVCYNGTPVPEGDIPQEVGEIIALLSILPFESGDGKTTCPTCEGVGLVVATLEDTDAP